MEEKNIKRRKFLGQLSAAGLLSTVSFLPGAAIAKELQEITFIPGKHKFLTKPYLQNPSPTSMNVMFLTDRKCYSWVEYGKNEELGQTANSDTDGLVDAYTTVNSIGLSNLTPGKKYFYRVGSKEIFESHPNRLKTSDPIYSETYFFTTPAFNPDRVSFLMFNDIHDRPESIPHLMKINGESDYDFVFFNGDVFNQQVDEDQIINNMLNPCTDTFACSKPFIMSRGNHETRGKYSRDLHQYFTNNNNSFFHSFEWGPVYFIILDTGEDKEDDHIEYGGLAAFDKYRNKQAVWLEKEMQTKAFKKAKFRVVMMHIPNYYSGEAHGTTHCRQLFSPLFDKYKVDVTLSGHTHRYGFHEPVAEKHTYPIIIGGGPRDGLRTISRIEANSKELVISMLRDDGVEVGRRIIKSKS